MSIRLQRNFWLFGIWPVVRLIIGVLAVVIHGAIALLVFPLSILVDRQTRKLRCPHCNVPTGKRTGNFGNVAFTYWSPFTPRHCAHCGGDISECPSGPGRRAIGPNHTAEPDSPSRGGSS